MRQRTDERIVEVLAAEEAADHADRFPAAAKIDFCQSTTWRRLDKVVTVEGDETGTARQDVKVVSWQQHKFARDHFYRWRALDRHQHPALDQEMIGDHLRRLRQDRPAILGGYVRTHRPGRRKARVEEDAPLETDRAEDLRQRIGHAGRLQFWTNDQLIKPRDHS